MTENPLRLVILGDPHIGASDVGLWEQTIEDINDLQSAMVLITGDLTGYGPACGTSAATRRAARILDGFHAPWVSVIGNHDLQAAEFLSDDAAVASFLQAVKRDTPWFRRDIGPVTVLGLSNTMHRRNPVMQQEVVFEDDQMNWFETQLTALGDRPVIVVAHVPPISSGLLTMLELHSQGGNAVANQNHEPGRILRQVWQHPNVIAWFSAHNHLGQHYRDAISVRLGVHFIHTGVAGPVTRDGYRHSRVLDIKNDQLEIRTFDHTIRRFDETLTYNEPHRLTDLVAWRRRMLGRRQPHDPVCMRQGPGPNSPPPDAIRFAWLCDSHAVKTLHPCQRRVFEWVLRETRAQTLDALVLGGDITHQADMDQAETVLTALSPGKTPLLMLPGNNEGPDLASRLVKTHKGIQSPGICARLPWPGHAFALGTCDRESRHTAIRQLTRQLPERGVALVLSHFPPDTTEIACLNSRLRSGLHIDWICGHIHESTMTDQPSLIEGSDPLTDHRCGSLTVISCAGLDPVKTRGTPPEILIADWDGKHLSFERRYTPAGILAAPPRYPPNPFGMASSVSVVPLLEQALAHGIDAVQCQTVCGIGPSLDTACETAMRFRERFPDGMLSLQLPVCDGSSRMTSGQADTRLVWAERMRVNDLAVMLPSIPVSDFEADRTAKTGGRTHWQKDLLELAEKALRIHAGFSLINPLNASRVSPAQERLGGRPDHLLALVSWLRAALADRGYAKETTERIGVCFDVGNAFRDPVVSKRHGLADWLQRLAPVVRSVRIHQVIPTGHGLEDMHPIDNLYGPRINFAGLLPVIRELLPPGTPILIAGSEPAAILESRRLLMH